MDCSFQPLLTLEQISEVVPLPSECRDRIEDHQRTTRNILSGSDKRTAIIVGPCSIHDTDLALEYGRALMQLSNKVSDKFFLIMRVYCEKPRSRGGWKGFAYNTNPVEDPHGGDVNQGLMESRRLLIELTNIGLPIAVELLDPLLVPYFVSLASWAFIGSRTCTSQTHRQLAADLTIPVGFKNEIGGFLQATVDSIISARQEQIITQISLDGTVGWKWAPGNRYAHQVLRGSVYAPNYDPAHVQKAWDLQVKEEIYVPIMVDCCHGNSQRCEKKAAQIFREVMKRIQTCPENERCIVGVMLESHLKGGKETSLTDPCVDWITTTNIINEAYEFGHEFANGV